jgi:hypothetical protein
LSAVVDWGTLPSPPASGLELAGGRKWSVDQLRTMSWVAGAEFFPSSHPATAPYIGEVDGSFWMLALSGRGCAGFTISQLEIGPCAGAEVVTMHSSPGSADFSRSAAVAKQTEYWLSFVGSLTASWNLAGPVDIALQIDLAVPTSRKIFGVAYNGLWDYVVSTAAVRGGLGLAYRF